MQQRAFIWLLLAALAACGDDPAQTLDASLTPDAVSASDAGPPDANPNVRVMTLRWSFTVNGAPVDDFDEGKLGTVIAVGSGLHVLGTAPDSAHEMVVDVGLVDTIRFVVMDGTWQARIYTIAPVPPQGDVMDVVLPYIDEPRTQLLDLAARVKTFYEAQGSLPVTGLDETSCCSPTGNVCAEDLAPWSVEPWASLGFAVHGPHRFHYFVLPNPPVGVTVEARANWDCSGDSQSWRIVGRIAADGQLVYDSMTVEDPTE